MEPVHKVQDQGLTVENRVRHHLSPKVCWIVRMCSEISSIRQSFNFLKLLVVSAVAKPVSEPRVMNQQFKIGKITESLKFDIFKIRLDHSFLDLG